MDGPGVDEAINAAAQHGSRVWQAGPGLQKHDLRERRWPDSAGRFLWPLLHGPRQVITPNDDPVSLMLLPSWKELNDNVLAWELFEGRGYVFLYPWELQWLLIPQFMTSRCLLEGDTHKSDSFILSFPSPVTLSM